MEVNRKQQQKSWEKTVLIMWSQIWATFSFDVLGINAENLKVNKCSHTNKREQISI